MKNKEKDVDVLTRTRELRAAGKTLDEIGDILFDEGFKNKFGKRHTEGGLSVMLSKSKNYTKKHPNVFNIPYEEPKSSRGFIVYGDAEILSEIMKRMSA